MRKQQIKEIHLLPNQRSLTVWDHDNKQIGELQGNLITFWAAYAERYGYDPEGICFDGEYLHKMPGGWMLMDRAEYDRHLIEEKSEGEA